MPFGNHSSGLHTHVCLAYKSAGQKFGLISAVWLFRFSLVWNWLISALIVQVGLQWLGNGLRWDHRNNWAFCPGDLSSFRRFSGACSQGDRVPRPNRVPIYKHFSSLFATSLLQFLWTKWNHSSNPRARVQEALPKSLGTGKPEQVGTLLHWSTTLACMDSEMLGHLTCRILPGRVGMGNWWSLKMLSCSASPLVLALKASSKKNQFWILNHIAKNIS